MIRGLGLRRYRVGLETLRFEDPGNGRTRLRSHFLVESSEARDGRPAGGMSCSRS